MNKWNTNAERLLTGSLYLENQGYFTNSSTAISIMRL